ncbi:GNAT family N-acetyltransferase [Actinoplanes regularis]|uniref:GNAT family N-acetyltransferase n=1 Tax=Actinoplanes regularis TaxID=52697 RepID=UPI00249FFACA|nr:GNAT family N-acetyltransferase [Actinoplanes regularis]GLW28142.1 hypothetical protein Areg01_10820 [Actinoplanes regularis]
MTFSVEVTDGVCVRDFEPDDEPVLQEVFAASGGYFEALNGDGALPGDLQSLFYAAPEGVSPDTKRILVVERDTKVIGVLDAVPGHPADDAVAVGVFLLDPAHRRQGIGSSVLHALFDVAREQGFRRVAAATPAGWAPGAAFLAAAGFALEVSTETTAGVGNRVVHRGEGPILKAALDIA